MLFFWWAHLDIWKKREPGWHYRCPVHLFCVFGIDKVNPYLEHEVCATTHLWPLRLDGCQMAWHRSQIALNKVTVSKLLQLGAPIEWRKTYWKYKVQHSVRRDVGWKKVPQIKNVGQFNFISSNPISRSGSNINYGSTHSMRLLNPNIEIPPILSNDKSMKQHFQMIFQ